VVCCVWTVVGGDELGLLGMERLLVMLRWRKGQIGGCWCGDWKREVGGWLGCVEVEKPLLEGGDEGNDQGKRGKSVLGLWVCGGKEWSGRERGRLVKEKIGNSCSGGS